MSTPLPYDEQERRLRAAVQAYLAAGGLLNNKPYAHAGIWAAIYLTEYLPDGTYGAEGHVLFTVKSGKRHGEYRDWFANGDPCTHRLYEHGRAIKDYLES